MPNFSYRIKFYKTGVGADVLGIRYRGVQDLQSIEQFMNRNIGKDAEVWLLKCNFIV
jgi:hypothetical protein